MGHRGDRRADEPALPARRGVDELLELGPAVRLGGDALAVRVGERIDRDPVARLAGGPADQLPRALGLGASVRSRRPKANQRASSSRSRKRRSARNRSGVGRSCRVALRKPAATAASSGQRTPWIGPMPGRDAMLPGQVLGVGEAREARGQRPSRSRRDRWTSSASEARGLGRVAARGDERDGPARSSRRRRGRSTQVP